MLEIIKKARNNNHCIISNIERGKHNHKEANEEGCGEGKKESIETTDFLFQHEILDLSNDPFGKS